MLNLAKYQNPKIEAVITIGKTLLRDMERCDLFKHASAMAYVTLFSLIPSLAATFGLISLFKPFLGKDSSLLVQVKSFILSNLATGTGEQLVAQMDEFLSNLDMTKIGLTGFAGLLFTLVMLLRQVEIALNSIWLVQKPRNVFKRFIYFWTFLTLGTLIIGLCVGVLSGFSLHRLNPFSHADLSNGQMIISAITPYLTVFIFFALLYKVVPNTFVGTKYAIYGAIPASLLFNLAGASYSWFAPNFTNYRAIYGALAAIPLFLMWLYILWLITLFGALLAWRFEQSFAVKDDAAPTTARLSATEKLRNHQLQAMMPLVALLEIYRRFREGKGDGVSGQELASDLNVAQIWIQEALDVLIDKKLIIAAANDNDLGTWDIRKFFPCKPEDKLTPAATLAELSNGTKAWIEEWQPQSGDTYRTMLLQTLDRWNKAPSATI